MAKTFKQKRKKVSAIQWDGKNLDAINEFLGEGSANVTGRSLVVKTKNMVALVNHNEYLVIGSDEKISAMDEKTFKDTYKPEDNGK